MPIKALREFLRLEASSGIILFFAAVLAIIFDNTFLRDFYQLLLGLQINLHLGIVSLSKPLLSWINEGLMAIFFLLIGLEIKREMLAGELNSFARAVLPAVAAIGGMLVPAIIYVAINLGDSAGLRGWAIPTATDIAFSLGVLVLLSKRVPASLRIFLTALAIFDDLGAIVVIAIFYSKNIAWLLLTGAVVCILVLLLLNWLRVTKITPYLIVGIVLWGCVLESGVHATLAGIVVALAIPLRNPKDPAGSPLQLLEHRLHPWVAFLVLPIFGFANAGVSFAGITVADFLSPITLGITLGLFLGKQIGVTLATWLAIRIGFARLPRGADFWGIYGIGLLAGVGFTMSLFIGSLAFDQLNGSYIEKVRLGVILGSLLSGVVGCLVFRMRRI